MEHEQITTYFRKWATGLVITSSITPAFAAGPSTPRINADEAKISHYMSLHDVPSFLLMDKKRGTLVAIQDGKIKKRFNALSGEKVGDSNDKGMTPAGIFPMELHKNIPTYGNTLVFNYKDQTDRYTAIHTVLDIPGENRLNRLKSTTAKDNRISHDGCINVSERDLKEIQDITTTFPKTIRHDTGKTSFAPNGFLVVLPEQESLDTFFGITP